MAQTTVPVGSPLARKIYGAALFARIIQAPSFTKTLTGEAPNQGSAESKLKGQTAATMPIVRVTDLSKTQGDTVSVDLFDTINGKPIVGDRSAEGTGEKLTSSSMDVRIDLLTKAVDAGAKMGNQRTVHNLRGVAMAQLEGYFPRLYDQMAICHLAGARGSMTGRDWIIPTAGDVDFSDIAVNSIKAPTYNRHFVVDTASTGNIIQGGAQLNSIGNTDIMTLEHIDTLSLLLDDQEFPMPTVKVADDPAASDEPIKAILWVTPRQWYHMQTAGGTSNTWRTFLQNAWVRKSYGSKHPLFSGEPGLWNGILVKKLPRFTVRFESAEAGVKYVAVGDRYTGTESSVTIGSISGFAVERAILTGGQALAMAYGRNAGNGGVFNWMEREYNFKRGIEVAGDAMFGMSKLRFNFADKNGNSEPTDYGVAVVDSVVKL
jgi:N4-gp56 family major capsid protein